MSSRTVSLRRIKRTAFRFVARYRKSRRLITTAPTLDRLYERLNQKHISHDERVIVGFEPPKGAICVYRYSFKA